MDDEWQTVCHGSENHCILDGLSPWTCHILCWSRRVFPLYLHSETEYVFPGEPLIQLSFLLSSLLLLFFATLLASQLSFSSLSPNYDAPIKAKDAFAEKYYKSAMGNWKTWLRCWHSSTGWYKGRRCILATLEKIARRCIAQSWIGTYERYRQ